MTPSLALPSSAKGSHLAFALRLLPKQRGADALVFYRFCRTVDDIADDPAMPPEAKHALLQQWLTACQGTLPPELENVVVRYQLPRDLLAEIVHGCAMDVVPQRFATLDALEAYCWRVACAVGLISIRIFGCQDSRSHDYALHLGHALQLTNILRDVGEDALMQRIYLPSDILARHGVSEDDILTAQPQAGFAQLMKEMAAIAHARFAAAVVPPADRDALLPARVMQAIYKKILLSLEVSHFPVFGPRLRLTRWQKLTTAASVILLGRPS